MPIRPSTWARVYVRDNVSLVYGKDELDDIARMLDTARCELRPQTTKMASSITKNWSVVRLTREQYEVAREAVRAMCDPSGHDIDPATMTCRRCFPLVVNHDPQR